MADPSGIPPTRSGSDTLLTSKKGRRATRLKKLAINRSGNQRLRVEFDGDCLPIGPMEDQFKSFVAVLAKSKASILIEDWDHVPTNVKDQIWDSIMLTFEVPDTERMKKKWISYAGERWRAFKTQLSGKYIHGHADKSPLEMYPFLDQETWDRFVQIRLDPAFQEKRKKAQEIQSKNLYPHRLSRGGYKKLRRKMIEEKKKQLLEQASQADPTADPPPEVVDPPPPPRHHTWKRARQGPSGQYTSEEARLVAEKIDSLDEQSTQGTFVSTGGKDVLAVAIGKEDHPGRVLGVGWGVGITQYHGPSSHHRKRDDIESIKAQLREEIKRDLLSELASMGFSQQNTSAQPSVPVSTMGSCDHSHQPDKEDDQCELYVDDHHDRRVVAFGRVHNLGNTLHHQTLEDDHVRVVVEDVLDVDALVPVPTEEVITVGQAPGNFIPWPRRLVMFFVSAKDDGKDHRPKRPRSDPRKLVASGSSKGIDKDVELDALERLALAAVKLGKESAFINLEHDGKPDTFYIPQRDIMEICIDSEMLCMTVVSLWCTYLHRLCIDRGNLHLYGFLDPQLIQGETLRSDEITAYMRRVLDEGKKQFYLAPYLHLKHWQLLIICRGMSVVVFFCSLGRKPTKEIKLIVETAMNASRVLDGGRPRPIRWIYPNCHRQRGDWECGYYVMKWMFNIVSASITDRWKEIFDNPEAFSEEDIKDIKERWANFFLEMTSEH